MKVKIVETTNCGPVLIMAKETPSDGDILKELKSLNWVLEEYEDGSLAIQGKHIFNRVRLQTKPYS